MAEREEKSSSKWLRKIAITGSNGIIGKVLASGLSGYHLTLADLPTADLRDFRLCSQILRGHDAVIHLAWNTRTEHWQSPRIDPDNTTMFSNICRAALAENVGRVIVASSIHVEQYRTWSRSELISPQRDPIPDSPYGAHKIFIERLGRWYAQQGLEVICVRFGGVCPLGIEPWADIPVVGLSYPDCLSLVRCCLDAPRVPSNFAVFYGVSENKHRIHDYVNPFGWKPETDAAIFYSESRKAVV